ETYEEIQHIPPTIPWYKKPWAIASFSLFFITALSLSLFFIVYGTYQKDKDKISETAESIVVETTEGKSALSETSKEMISEPIYKYKLIFTSDYDGDSDIYSVNSDGTELVNLKNDNLEQWSPSYSIGSSKIVYTCRTKASDSSSDEIFIMDTDGSNIKQLTSNNFSDWAPAISLDGSKIVFTSNRGGNDEIYIMNSDGSDQIRLTNNSAIDDHPKISPSGSKIVFLSERSGNAEIYLMNIDGTGLKRLTNNPSWDGFPCFSPDGYRIAFVSERDGNVEIYLMNADGSNQTRLTNNTFYDLFPAFSLNGNKITFTRIGENNKAQICIMNIDGSGEFVVPLENINGSGSVFIQNKDNLENFIEIDSKNREGVKFIASNSGLYEFKIVGGAYTVYWYPFEPNKKFNWNTYLSIFINQSIKWSGDGECGKSVVNEDRHVGYSDFESFYEAENSKYINVFINLKAGDYIILLVPDGYNCYDDNLGTVIVNAIKISDLSPASKETSIISDGTSNISKQGENTNETTVQNETPAIKLQIIDGPTLAEDGSICYYRVKAIATGEPTPTIKFSKDDSNGVLGSGITQVNLTRENPTYTLIATATNTEGKVTDSIKLEWTDDNEAMTENVQSPNIVSVVVSGTQGWQSTGVTVKEGQRIQITYKDGTWAGRVGFGPSLPDIWTDAGGIDFQIYYPEFGITSRFASLVGKIGDGSVLQIGSFYDAISVHSGTLFLSMFDIGMDDNAGSINVQVITYP
ncbi:MAG: hypothetical protein FJW61_02325, partial [Actinobacteria bacterium]|nr:hypothetical protein [Actinomycetota bacterium]